MPFKDLPEGQTHSYNDGCGMPEHNMTTTYSDDKSEINIEAIKSFALSVQKMKSKDLPKSVSWLAKIMAKFGWHRQYEIIVVDSKQFGYMGSSIWHNKKPN